MKVSHYFFLTLSVLALLSLTACGNDSSSKKDSPKEVTTENEIQDDQGIYRAILRPLNNEVAGESSGTLEVKIEGDEIIMESTMVNTPAGVKHLQSIMIANVCPDVTADTNQDGLIDINEAMASTGKILIPLDSDLSEQLNGMEFGPIANSSGSFVYRRSTTLTRLFADLFAPDPDMEDAIEKLTVGNYLTLAGRVVIVQGVKASTNLPDTVSQIGNLSPEQSLPIACGQLTRIESEDPNAPTSLPEPLI